MRGAVRKAGTRQEDHEGAVALSPYLPAALEPDHRLYSQRRSKPARRRTWFAGLQGHL